MPGSRTWSHPVLQVGDAGSLDGSDLLEPRSDVGVDASAVPEFMLRQNSALIANRAGQR